MQRERERDREKRGNRVGEREKRERKGERERRGDEQQKRVIFCLFLPFFVFRSNPLDKRTTTTNTSLLTEYEKRYTRDRREKENECNQ